MDRISKNWVPCTESTETEHDREEEMTLLLECREKIKQFYRLNSVIILPVVKFLVAFITLNGVNTMMGYMPRLDNIAIVLITSLACSFLPAGCLTLLCALFSLAHMYSLSLEVAIIGVCVYLILYLMLFRFAPKDSYVVVLTPLLFALKIPYVVPIAVGLTSGPVSAVPVACGVIVYYFLTTIVGCAPTLRTMGDEMADRIRFLLETIMSNRTVVVIAGAFAVTVIVVYLIRRMSVEYAWTIAMVAGAMTNLVVLLVGDLLYDINLSMGSAILGSIIAVLVAKVIEFFRFCVDYSRTEKVQFEDDEYYYYVKAVPKMSVAVSTRTVKKINSQNGVTAGSSESRRTAAGTVSSGRRTGGYEEEYEAAAPARSASQRPASQRPSGTTARPASQSAARQTSRTGTAGMSSGSGSYGGTTRSVTTERTARTGGNTVPGRSSSYSTRGVTVGSSNKLSDDSDDYEELF